MKAVEIRRDSWHFKVYRFVQDPFVMFDRWDTPSDDRLKNRAKEPAGLCGYFWTVALGPLIVLTSLGVWGAIFAALVVPVGVVWLLYRGGRWTARRVRRSRTSAVVAAPLSLTASYVAARKARVCPRVIVR